MASQLGLSLLIGAVMPLAVLFSFIAMKLFGVDANIVRCRALRSPSHDRGHGIILCQNIVQHLEEATPDESRP